MELSRSEQKRRIKQLGKLVVELVALPPGLIGKLPVNAEIREYLGEVKGLKGSARKRQIKYITKLLRNEQSEPLYDFVSKRKGNYLIQNKQFHEIEYLRDILIEEAIETRRQARAEHHDMVEHWDSKVILDIADELPLIDSKALTRLSFLFAMTRSKKHSREIFRVLQAAQEQEEIKRKQNNR